MLLNVMHEHFRAGNFLNPGAAHLWSPIPWETGNSSLSQWAAPRSFLYQNCHENGGSS
jgi:hypothetical protein